MQRVQSFCRRVYEYSVKSHRISVITNQIQGFVIPNGAFHQHTLYRSISVGINSLRDSNEIEGSFKNDRGQNIFYREWRIHAESGPRALVVLSHGFGDHSGRMRELGQALAQNNYLATCMDYVGMGRSEGERGQIKSVEHYMTDLVQHTRRTQADNPGVPTFLAGHSMGSHVGVRTVMQHPNLFNGIISSAAPLTINPRLITPTRKRIGIMASYLFPSLEVQKFDNSKMSRDPNVGRKFEKDELCYRGGLKAGWCYAMYCSLLYVLEHMEKLTTPLLALHGGDDVICETRGSRDLVARANSKDKTLKIYDGAYHSLFLEPDYRDQVIADTIEWIEARIPRKWPDTRKMTQYPENDSIPGK